jgi:hypothetical protein
MIPSRLAALVLATAIVGTWGGCGPDGGNGTGRGVGGGGNETDLGAGNGDDAGSGNGNGNGNGNGCVGLQCQQMSCTNGQTTTLTGTVFAPNGTLPLYNAIVYVPNAAVEAFTPGVTCDRCSGHVSGSPLVTTQTDASGNFTLTNVPVGNDIPLVIQIGRWRRQVKIPSVPACQTTPITDVNLTRMPKNASEGDIPQMAIATGSSDPFECLLLQIGLDSTEITAPSATPSGRVHFFTATDSAGTDLMPAAPKADQLYSSLTNLLKYDVIILPCEGSGYDKPAMARSVLEQYVNAGGRLFTTHYSYDWLSYTSSPFNAVGTWDLDQDFPNDPTIGTIDQSFPKGMAFAQWLKNVAPTTTLGQLSISQPRHDIDAVNTMNAQQWISAQVTNGKSPNAVMHLTFDTPLGAPLDDGGVPAYCGKVVYSDFHVSTDAADSSKPFPSACTGGALTPQEKALVFMLFDLSSCIQSENQPPIP